MNRFLDPLGSGRVFRDRRTGALVVDEDSIGRRGFAGEGPDATGYSDDPDYSGEPHDGADGEFEGEGEDFGARHRYPSRGYGQRHSYPNRQLQPYRQPAPVHHQPTPAPRQPAPRVERDPDGVPDGWVSAVLSGSASIDEAGQVTVTIRAQHPFIATDLTFEGSSNGAMITKIDFGDRPVITANGGLSTSVFTPTSQMRKHLKGQHLQGGLDITVIGTLEGAGKLCAAFFGFKPPMS